MNQELSPSYYAVIPANVRYAKIPPNAKLLYGEITALCNDKGYCWATNRYFAELYDKTESTISVWVSALEKCNFISVIIEDYNLRKIYLREAAPNEVLEKSKGGIRKIERGVLEKSKEQNNTINNTYTTTMGYSDQPIENKERDTSPGDPTIDDLIASGKVGFAKDLPAREVKFKDDTRTLILKKIGKKKLVSEYLIGIDMSADDFIESFVNYCWDNGKRFRFGIKGMHELLEIHSSMLSREIPEETSPVPEEFKELRKLHPGKKQHGLEDDFSNYKKKNKDWKELLPKLKEAIEAQIENRERHNTAGVWIEPWKHFRTWINQRCWNAELIDPIIPTSVNTSPELDNYDLSPEMEMIYDKYTNWVAKKFPSLFKSNCRIYSKDDFYDLATDRSVTARKFRITDTEYKEIKEKAHKDLEEKAYLRTEFKTVYEYTRKLMKIEIHA